MYSRRYFPGRYFASGYWAGSASEAQPTLTAHLSGTSTVTAVASATVAPEPAQPRAPRFEGGSFGRVWSMSSWNDEKPPEPPKPPKKRHRKPTEVVRADLYNDDDEVIVTMCAAILAQISNRKVTFDVVEKMPR